MITLFIILVIIAIIASCKKDKHDYAEDAQAISALPAFTIYAKPMNAFSKFMNLAGDKSQLLNTFSYANGEITIIMENGKMLSCPLHALTVIFTKENGLISYSVKTPDKNKVGFYQTTNISKDEWTAISGVLCLASTTYGKEIFSQAYKNWGYVNTVIKVLNHL